MLTPEQTERLKAQSGIGKPVYFKDKTTGERQLVGVVEDEVFIIVNDYKHLIQRIRVEPNYDWDNCGYSYRTGYYTYDKDLKNIKWGQYTQFLTEKEYQRLLNEAKNKGWPIFGN